MKETLRQINRLVASGIIEKYAIAGGIAHFYYIEPSVTFDLDLIVAIAKEENTLTPLTEIYDWSKKNNFETLAEHIVIAGIPVQFLPPYNDLVKEALENRQEITLFEEVTYILSPEYLMAIMLQTGRASDKERLTKFFDEAVYNNDLFEDIVIRFNLTVQLSNFRKIYE
ncbi:MAG: hypothetical protein EOM90_12095 [Alphaproteobacteria bacterium]|nr:hypothetical protein [Alphaproteobacteria bacterium]